MIAYRKFFSLHEIDQTAVLVKACKNLLSTVLQPRLDLDRSHQTFYKEGKGAKGALSLSKTQGLPISFFISLHSVPR